MFPPPTVHHRLWTAAAVASGWPVLRARTGTEADLLLLLQAIEAAAGPLPQAVIDEPWDEGEWALEVAFPELDAVSAMTLGAIDSRLWWTPGPRPTLSRAIERGERLDEVWSVGGVQAVQALGPTGAVLPELQRSGVADPAVTELEAELREALRAVDPALESWSDRGADTVAAVVDPATGRFGVLVSLLPERFSSLDGSALAAKRLAVFEALGAVVAARADHPVLRLAPDVQWWAPLEGLDVVLWAVAPAIPTGEQPIADGISPTLDVVAAIAATGDSLQVLLVPGEGGFDAIVQRGMEVAEQFGAGGGPVEWVRRENGWVFAPSWFLAEVDQLEEAVAAFAGTGASAVHLRPMGSFLELS